MMGDGDADSDAEVVRLILFQIVVEINGERIKIKYSRQILGGTSRPPSTLWFVYHLLLLCAPQGNRLWQGYLCRRRALWRLFRLDR